MKNVPWFVLDTNKGVILPSDSGSLLHDIPSEKCAYKILCILLSPEIRDSFLI